MSKNDPPLRVPDPSATIPDFGPRPDLSDAPNLAALLGPPSKGPESMTPEPNAPATPEPAPAPVSAPEPLSRAAKGESAPASNRMLYIGIAAVVVAIVVLLSLSSVVAALAAAFFFTS